jgi:hypothetical protein
MHPRLPVALGVLAVALSCAPAWQRDEVLGVDVEWPEGGPRPYRVFARAVCDAADASSDPRLLNGASVVVLATQEEVNSVCLQSATGCWHPDYDDEDGAGTIYLGPPGDGGQFSDATLRHELGHLARWRWYGNADHDHEDLKWWARYDSPPVCMP